MAPRRQSAPKSTKSQRAKQTVDSTPEIPSADLDNGGGLGDYMLAERTIFSDGAMTSNGSNSAVTVTNSDRLSGLDFSRLPLNLATTLPDFQALMSVSDVSKPASFAAAGFQRVTDQQREIDKVEYAEYKNYADNIGDGINVLISMADAAIKGAKLGQKQVQYATAREGINTELVNFNIQQAKTNQANAKLTAENMKTDHQVSVNDVQKDIFSTQLDDLRLTLSEQQAKLNNRQQALQALLASTSAV